jgi:hypothetical protein
MDKWIMDSKGNGYHGDERPEGNILQARYFVFVFLGTLLHFSNITSEDT